MLAPATGSSKDPLRSRPRSSRAFASHPAATEIRVALGEMPGDGGGASVGAARRSALDIGGTTVDIICEDGRYAAVVADRLGSRVADSPASAILAVGAEPPPLPAAEPDEWIEGLAGWQRGPQLWLAGSEAVARIESGSVTIGGPVATIDDRRELAILTQCAVALALADDQKLLIHVATIASGDDAVAVLGASGRGKSTLAAAALVGGWTVLGDDLAVVRTDDRSITGVARPPMVPFEVTQSGALVENRPSGRRLDWRGRARLPASVLGIGSYRLIGLVVVGHGTTGSMTPVTPSASDVLDLAMAVPPFSFAVRRHLRAGAALVGLPTVELRHGADPSTRLQRAGQLLSDAFNHLRSTDDRSS